MTELPTQNDLGKVQRVCGLARTLSAVALPCRNMKMSDGVDAGPRPRRHTGRRDGPTRFRLPLGRGELAARSVDLLATGVPDGHRDAVGRDRLDERLLVLGPRGGPFRARG